ncbi:hypothetical protein [Methylobacterium indicum]|uniref:hypothetical protein n=1 Tax=Methylobacterium indicum TaxID=1775910 RepID=UPI00069D2EAF|nr:hypothetical protein [Methylobacterium indicum]
MTDRPKRKSIPDRVKLEVVLAQGGTCTHCSKPLGKLSGVRFDHRPPIALRRVNEAGTDYDPPQLDPGHLEALHEACHDERTTGRRGESKLSARDGDQTRIAKVKRLVERYQPAAPVEEERRLPPADEFERRRSELLRPESRPRAEKRSKWPSRPFSKKESRR